MASRRDIKRDLNYMVYDIWDECFFVMGLDPNKTAQAEELVENAGQFQDEMLEKINAAKNKADFKVIRQALEKAAEDFVLKLNKLA